MADKLLDKLAAILNKAELSDNEHERDAFMKAAQHLSTLHSIDLAVARSHTRSKGARSVPTIRRVELGSKGNRGSGAYAELFHTIARVNDVYIIFINNGAYVDAFGMSVDIDQTEALYGVLITQMVNEANQYLDLDTWRRDDVTKLQARKAFYHGFTTRIGRRLMEAKRSAEREASQRYRESGFDTLPVLREQKREVSGMYWSKAGGLAAFRNDKGRGDYARTAGDMAGRKARTHRQEEFREALKQIE